MEVNMTEEKTAVKVRRKRRTATNKDRFKSLFDAAELAQQQEEKDPKKERTVRINEGKEVPWAALPLRKKGPKAKKLEEFENFFLTGKQIQRGDNGKPKSTTANLQATLMKCPAFIGRIRADIFKGVITYAGRKWWVRDYGEELWKETDTIGLRAFLESGYGMKYSKQDIDDMVRLTAENNRYSSLKDFFLYELPKWDGRPRLKTLFHDALGAEDNEVNALIAKKTILGGIERALCDDNGGGVDFKGVAILQGDQSAGKSLFWEMLTPDPSWFTQSKVEIGNKDGYLVLKGAFIIEFGELESLKRKEVTAVKDFISNKKDKYRPPFGREVVDVVRHCIFVGSTNEDEFLADQTGNTRFKVVPIPDESKKGAAHVAKFMTPEYVKQLWAEGMALREQGEQHFYSDADNVLTEKVAEKFTVKSIDSDYIKALVLAPKPAEWENMDPYDRRDWLDRYIDGDPVTLGEAMYAPKQRFRITEIMAGLNVPEWERRKIQREIKNAITRTPGVKAITYQGTRMFKIDDKAYKKITDRLKAKGAK